MKTYYPQSALEGFATAIGSMLDVRFEIGTGKAATDGKTITLPAIRTPLDADEFAGMCGVALHEASHVYFDSWRIFNDYAGSDLAQDTLKRACMNFVLDVADETRIEKVIPSARELIQKSNEQAEAELLKTDAFNKGDPVWMILSAAFLWARIGPGNTVKPLKKHPKFVMMKRTYGILKKAKDRYKTVSKGGSSRKRTADLIDIADKLVALLKSEGDAAGAPCNQQGQTGQGQGACGAGTGSGEGQGQPAPGDAMADESDGIGMALAQPADPSQGEEGTGEPAQVQPGAGAGTHAGTHDEPCNMDMGLYMALRPAMIAAAERMSRVDNADGAEGGYLSGSGLSRNLERAMIDGHCFSRRVAEGEKIHAVVLLDNSGSMHGRLEVASAIAQVFTEAIQAVAQTCELATFESDTARVRNFRNVSADGGTNTFRAVDLAHKILHEQCGRRVVVMVTDGQTCEPDRCAAACSRLRADGIEIIGIAYQCSEQEIRGSMPGARIIAAQDHNALSIQLNMIAGQIAAMS